ncbi:integral membrane protein 2B isoform X1 [Anabrus simplex]|uniref:integral membrane protein 2B isoform X1 n=1 Tax=Anabrus simplex TaxID=316456 RepID=UPI0035A2C00A
MAFKNLVFLVAVAIFLQSAVADPVLIRRWGAAATNAPEENEVLKVNGQEIVETNYVNEFSADPDPEIAEVDVDVVPIPQFTDSELIRFVHDFNYNKTAIIDPYRQRCFVMDLDYDRYALPSSVFDLFWKMNTNYYGVDLEVIRENMRVLLPQIEDTEGLGPVIQWNCLDFHTYMLIRVEIEAMVKRSISEELPAFRERVGERLLEFRIVNMEEVTDYEKNM